ncbi:MAG: hypothetical protein MK110_03120 [Fuerstiella sp.]|nr:hypothetical protein [Fuerstiella sp.]
MRGQSVEVGYQTDGASVCPSPPNKYGTRGRIRGIDDLQQFRNQIKFGGDLSQWQYFS